MVTAFIARHFTDAPSADITKPLPTVTAIDHNALVTSHMVKLRGTNVGHGVDEPLHTISAGGNHLGEVRAFLMKYYGTGTGESINSPMGTVTTKDRFGLVVVEGEQYQIVDIGMRMLEPHELYRAHGFPSDYVIATNSVGKKLSKKTQVRMVGNSVPIEAAKAFVQANFGLCAVREEVAA